MAAVVTTVGVCAVPAPLRHPTWRASRASARGSGIVAGMHDDADKLLLEGVARPCPDCAEERLFVSADLERADLAEYCCTWCGAALLIDPVFGTRVVSGRDVA